MLWEAPAKLNLSLHVKPARSDGYHPLESLVQTVDWCDRLSVEVGEGSDILESDIEDNLVIRAIEELRGLGSVPPLSMELDKSIPIEAGLGGGSSDAAAAIKAASKIAKLDDTAMTAAAGRVGADVNIFLTGGSLMMRGVGEQIESLRPLHGFAVAIVVPEFGVSTADAYRRWDELEGPVGEITPDELLPPALRGGMPVRNDLLPAAMDLAPGLGDFMADLRSVWGTAAFMTGSGSACFGYFPDVSEASDAAAAVAATGRGVELRPVGVAEVDI